MDRSESITDIAAALAAFNAEVTNPPENQTATVKSKKGEASSYTYRFVDLAAVTDAVRPLLAKHGLSVLQDVLVEESRVGAVTIIIHVSGQWLSFSPLWVPAGPETKDYGGGVTYSRRYALMAALDLASAEDPEAPHTRGADPGSKAASSGAATDAQLKKIHVEQKQAGVSDGALMRMVNKAYSTNTLESLTKGQASHLIERLIAEKERRAAATAAGADPATGEVAPATGEDADAAAAASEDEDAGKDFWPTDGEVPGDDAEAARARWAAKEAEKAAPATTDGQML